MNTPTAQIIRHRPIRERREPVRLRAELPAMRTVHSTNAMHDFLIPNPRPDLIFDRPTLRMIEVP